MAANVATKFGWTPMKIVEKLKTAAACGPVLRKFQSAIILQFMADRQKSDSLYDYDTLYKV